MSEHMGGSSGALYGILLNAAAAHLCGNREPQPIEWAEALLAGGLAIQKYGGASLGDRTMLDALLPAANHLVTELKAANDPREALNHAARLAQRGSEAVSASFSYLPKRLPGD